MDPDQQLRNLRDFLLVYNRMTEICFQRCSSNFNYRNLTMEEERCVDNCAGKLIRSNHRLMGTYVQLMPRMVQRRMDEMESKAKAAEAAASANVGPPATEASPASQTPVTLAPPPEAPPVLTPAVADVGQEAYGSLLKPAGLDIPVDLSTVASSTAVATEVKLSAATPLTPATEAVNPGVLNDAGHGPSHTAGFPQMSIAGAQTESESLMHMSAPFKPTPLTGDAPVSAVPAPAVSKPTESLSGPERAPEVAPPSSQ